MHNSAAIPLRGGRFAWHLKMMVRLLANGFRYGRCLRFQYEFDADEGENRYGIERTAALSLSIRGTIDVVCTRECIPNAIFFFVSTISLLSRITHMPTIIQ